MRTSSAGLAAIIRSEGVVPAPYIDPVGVWTYGIGHTKAAGDPDPEKMPRGMPADVSAAIKHSIALFQARIGRYERDVSAAVTVPVKQHEFDALVSFHYNTGAIRKASATDALNRGDREDAARRLTLYNKGRVNGELVVLKGLVARREEERAMFLDRTYPQGGVPVWTVKANNRVGGQHSVLTPSDIDALLSPGLAPRRDKSGGTGFAAFIAAIAAFFRGMK